MNGIPKLLVSCFFNVHLKRETRTKEGLRGLSPAASVPCEAYETRNFDLSLHPCPFPVSFPFQNRLSVVESALFRFVFRFTFYSPFGAWALPFHVSFLSFLVSRVHERKVKRKVEEVVAAAPGPFSAIAHMRGRELVPL
jgi:hypothetical protein